MSRLRGFSSDEQPWFSTEPTSSGIPSSYLSLFGSSNSLRALHCTLNLFLWVSLLPKHAYNWVTLYLSGESHSKTPILGHYNLDLPSDQTYLSLFSPPRYHRQGLSWLCREIWKYCTLPDATRGFWSFVWGLLTGNRIESTPYPSKGGQHHTTLASLAKSSNSKALEPGQSNIDW